MSRDAAIREQIQEAIRKGVAKTTIAEEAGVSRQALYDFLQEERQTSDTTLDKLDDWLRGEIHTSEDLTSEREKLSKWLRWLLALLETDQPLPDLDWPNGAETGIPPREPPIEDEENSSSG